MKFTFKQFIVPNFGKRLAFMLPAVILMGVFVSILVEIGWGTDPASFMNLNVADALGWGLGNTEVLLYGIMLIFTFIFGAEMIGFGTLANMILIGYVIDLCRWIWKNIGFAQFLAEGNFAARVVIFALTLFLFVVVASIYINAQMGVAPYDAIPNILSGWWTKIPFAIIIGSVLMSLLLGPVISLVGKPLKKIL